MTRHATLQQPKRAEHSPPPPRPLAALPTRKHLFRITGPVGSKPFWPHWRSRGLSLTPPTRPASTARRPISTGRSRLGSIACGMRRSNDHATWRKEVFTRGVIGWHEPVFFGGEVVGHRLRKSDRCLEMYLRANDPAYRDRVDLTHAAPDGGPVRTATEVTVQLQPYEDAIRMMVSGIFARPALPAPTGPEVIDVEAVPASEQGRFQHTKERGRNPGETPISPGCGAAQVVAGEQIPSNQRTAAGAVNRPCSRCDGPGVNPYCPMCHGTGVIG